MKDVTAFPAGPPSDLPDAFPADFPARAVVDLSAIRDNVRALRSAAASSQVMAVVKADAYGHGLVPSAWAALAGGATWLGTAQACEALTLRSAGITADDARILTWLHAPGVDFEALVAADVDISVASPWALEGVAVAARATGRTARVHLKLDTGLGRNGIMPADLPGAVAAAAQLEAEGAVRVVGLFTHLAYADEPGHPTIAAQKVVLDDAARLVASAGIELEVLHAANSAATLTAPGLHYDLVRPGIAVYGFSPVPQVTPASGFGLRPAMTLQAKLATVKDVPAGHGVSYGHQYVTTTDTRLGVVPIGYADGIPRHASSGGAAGASGGVEGSGGPIYVGGPASAGIGAPGEDDADGGRVVRVAGRVCMDQVVLDLGPYASEQDGDVVTLFGSTDGLAHSAPVPSAEDWAAAAGTISYEIVSRVGSRVPRVYVGQDVLGERALRRPTAIEELSWS